MNVLNAKETLTFGRQYRGDTYLREVCENLERIVKITGEWTAAKREAVRRGGLAENQPGKQDVMIAASGGVYNLEVRHTVHV